MFGGQAEAEQAVDVLPHLGQQLRNTIKLDGDQALSKKSLKAFNQAFQSIQYWLLNRHNGATDHIFGAKNLVLRIAHHSLIFRNLQQENRKRRRDNAALVATCHGLCESVPDSPPLAQIVALVL